MNKISKKDYLKYSIDSQNVLLLEWVISNFSILMEDSKFVKLGLGNDIIVTINNEDMLLDGAIKNMPIFTPTEPMFIEKLFIENLDTDIETTVGRILLNHILLCYNFKNKIPFINEVIKVGDIESKYIAKLLKDTIKESSDINVDEYLAFIDACLYLENWADVISVSSTLKSILPPPGIKVYRDKLIKEVIATKGKEALNDYTVIADIENKLKQYDREYLSDDPSYGKLLDGKILDNSRKKLFLMTGAARNFKEDSKAELLETSLSEGWDTDPVKLTEQFNSIRHGSFARGKETFKGGLAAKILLRATSSMLIDKNDCGTKSFKNWEVTKDNAKYLIGRYIINNDKLLCIEDEITASTFINKVIKLRSPMYCLAKGENICSVCIGKSLSNNENSIPLLITSIGEVMLKSSLKKVHNNNVNTTEINLMEAIN
jgi:hypothetical protein